jgi:ribosomal protein L37AE/L43A
MNCPNCGAATSQGPNGDWSCGNCGWQTGCTPAPRVVSAHEAGMATGSRAAH